MRICQFNFNNEVDTFEIQVEEDGTVRVPGTNGEILAEYDSVAQMAEMFALARDVKAENLKNWVLLENGDVYSFVLRAGTAGLTMEDMEGLTVEDMQEQLEDAFNSLAGRFHALAVARARDQVLGSPSRNLADALIQCTETDIAGAIYDALEDVEAPVEEEPDEDTRTDAKRFFDDYAIPGVKELFAMLMNLPAASALEDVIFAAENHPLLSDYDRLVECYRVDVDNAMNNGIGVSTTADALTVLNQIPAYASGDEAKARMKAAASLARRSRVNLALDIVGRRCIRHTSTIVSLEELDGIELYLRGNELLMVQFDDAVDAELEAERDAEEREEEGEAEYDAYEYAREHEYDDEDDDEDEDEFDY